MDLFKNKFFFEMYGGVTASTCCCGFKEHAELCVSARKKKTQTIHAETNNSLSGYFAGLLASVFAVFASAWRREEEFAAVAA